MSPQFFRFLEQYWAILTAAALGLIAIFLLLPRPRMSGNRAILGGLAGVLALGLAGWELLQPEPVLVETILFYCFAGLAVLFGGLMITQTQPVRAALSFAMVILNTCGLFLLQAAPFLMAATIIIYAGAIVVTFLFVIMLAQQNGMDSADHRSREPLLACVAGFVLLAALLYVVRHDYGSSPDHEKLVTEINDKLKKNAVEDQKPKLLTDYNDLLKRVEQFLHRTDAAAKTNSVEKTNQLLEDPEMGDFRSLVQALEGLQQNYRKDLWNKLTDLEGDLPFHSKPVTAEGQDTLSKEDRAKLMQISALGWRLKNDLQGFLSPRSLPLSGFSGVKPNELPPLDGQGRVKMPADNVAALGRTLFTDYLVGVELAATLLLVATIGAIVIAGRKAEGLK